MKNMNERVKEYVRRHRLHGCWGKVVLAMICMVVFGTTYALILPAITLDHETTCGLEEHTHSAQCYAQQLVCTDESTDHVHSDDCYASVLTCEILEHQHTDACYPSETEEGSSESVAEQETTADAGDISESETEQVSAENSEAVTDAEDASNTEDLDESEVVEKSEASTQDEAEQVSEESVEAVTEEDAAADTENTNDNEMVTSSEAKELVLTEQSLQADVYTDASYSALADDSVAITLTGELPEGVVVKAYPVTASLDDSKAEVVQAYDIGLFVTVTDESTGETIQKEYEPESSVEVKITSSDLKDESAVSVYHIADEPGSAPEKVHGDVKVNENTVKFSASQFSTYVLSTEQKEDDSESADSTDKNSSSTDGSSDTTDESSDVTDKKEATSDEASDSTDESDKVTAKTSDESDESSDATDKKEATSDEASDSTDESDKVTAKTSDEADESTEVTDKKNDTTSKDSNASDETSNDGISLADVSQSGSTFTMEIGDSFVVNNYSGYNHSYSSCSSSNTSVATVSVGNRGTATVTGVGEGSSTVTLYYGYGWNSQTVTIYVTVSGSGKDEGAALYFLKNPMADPMSNATGGWVPDSTQSQSQIVGTVNTSGATWVAGGDQQGKNITSNPGNYIVAWPDGQTGGDAWIIDRNNTYFSQILELVFDEWKSELQSELGISDLQRSDITSITITPCKISRNNGTTVDKHIDCRIVLVSDKFFKTQFFVKEPGASDYDLQAYKFFRKGDKIPTPNSSNYSNYKYNYKIGDTRTVDGVTYVLKGWYTENEEGLAHSQTIADFSYSPSEQELKDGIVNFYAEWVPATNDLTIVKYEKGSKEQRLSGAEFTLSSDSGKTYQFEATNDSGETALENINWGTYTLSETTAPDNYQKIKDITVTVGEKISIEAGDTGAKLEDGKLWIPDEKATVDVTLKKVDGNNQNPLTGAEFYLYYLDESGTKWYYGEDGEWTADEASKATIAPDGEDAKTKLSELNINTTYYLVETKAPDGYNLLTEEIKITPTSTSNLTVAGSGASAEGKTVTVVNNTGETLPNTGGMGTGTYTLSGIGFMAVAMAGLWLYGGRKVQEGGVR